MVSLIHVFVSCIFYVGTLEPGLHLSEYLMLSCLHLALTSFSDDPTTNGSVSATSHLTVTCVSACAHVMETNFPVLPENSTYITRVWIRISFGN